MRRRVDMITTGGNGITGGTVAPTVAANRPSAHRPLMAHPAPIEPFSVTAVYQQNGYTGENGSDTPTRLLPDLRSDPAMSRSADADGAFGWPATTGTPISP